MELSEILGGGPAPEETPVTSTVETPAAPVEAAPVEPTTTVEQPRDERGRFSPKQEPVTAQVTEEKPHTVPVSALIEERRKRQELEQRLTQQQRQPVTDEQFWQAPAQATQQMLAEYQQAMQEQIATQRYNLAEDLTRTMHPDYDAVRDAFIAKVHGNDAWAQVVAQQMHAQPNPAKFVYDQMKRQTQLEQVGDLDSYKARLEAEIRAKVLMEMQKPAAPQVPRSLNSEPSAPTPSTPSDFAPTPLGNLFERPF
jgi:hypothetical protein